MIFSSRARFAAPFAIGVLATACAGPPAKFPAPIDYPRSPASVGLNIGNSVVGAQRPTETVVTEVPASPVTSDPRPAARPPTAAPAPGGDEVSMALEQTPLPMFIQILFGNVLKVPYSMDQSINTRPDIVTFKTSQPISRAKMQEVAINLLRTYQLSVQDLGGVIRITPESAVTSSPQAVLGRGKTLPDVPESLRPAFQHIELDVVRASDIGPWLRQIMGTRINVTDDANRNGFLLSGTQGELRQALELIRVLDQPRLRGRVARRITPAFLNPNELTQRLVDVLTAQGYGVATGQSPNVPILIIPVNAIGSIIVFATSNEVMDQVLKWVRELDRQMTAQAQNGIYTYAVKYADAQELARTLGEILTGGSIGPGTAPVAPAAAAGGLGAAAPTPTPQARSGANSRVVVNNPTNTLIIRGTTPEEYQQIMALLRELDRPVKSALIEVMVAELRLGASQALGIEWNITPQSGSNGSVQGGTLGRLGVGSAGLTLGFANRAGQLVGILNTLASNNQARILSNPKVLARNGETALIQVGQEVPVVTSQQSSGGGGLFGNNTGVLQTIQYRSTGVILRVRPVINSGNRLDLDVSQEVSSAAETRTGVSASPTISTRRIETKLSLRDGSTVLLGGLISRTNSDADTGIPFLKDIPGLGSFFKTQSGSNDQTELLIMITPYVVGDDFESEAITEAVLKTFGDWAQDIRPARVMPSGAPTRPMDSVPPMREPDRAPQPAVSEPPMRSSTSPAAVEPSPAPAPTPQPPGAGATTPDSGPAPAAQPNRGGPLSVDQGVTVSRPPSSGPGTTPNSQPVVPQNATPQPAPSPPPPNTTPRPPVPSNQPGTPVNDPVILKEIEELLKKQPRPR